MTLTPLDSRPSFARTDDGGDERDSTERDTLSDLPSPPRRESFAARLGERIKDALSPDRSSQSTHRGRTGRPGWDSESGYSDYLGDGETAMSGWGARKPRSSERSVSRGREPVISTGRGGAGNIRSPSAHGTRVADAEEDIESLTRGRHHMNDANKVTHSGRGGSGNVRSPSRDPAERAHLQRELELEERLQREAAEKQEREGVVPTGRGGAGNLTSRASDGSRSRSRSRTRDFIRSISRDRSAGPSPAGERRSLSRGRAPGEPLVSGGRGGLGNIRSESRDPEARQELERLEEEDRRVSSVHAHEEGAKVHHAGKGGAGNVAPAPGQLDDIDLERLSKLDLEERRVREAHERELARGGVRSSGRGGAGNVRDASVERRGRAPETKEHHGPGGLIGSVLRSFSRSKEPSSPSSPSRADSHASPSPLHSQSESPAPSQTPALQSSGRGGSRNTVPRFPSAPEHEPQAPQAQGGTAGRGGAGNHFAAGTGVGVDKEVVVRRSESRTGGRGGAGNVLKEREATPA